MQPDPTPYDAFLLVSFGGPEKPEDVVPFLENVTRGRGIPRERLVEVGEHYFHFGGKSPINERNQEFLDAIREDFAGNGLDLPVYWGNRNWAPFLTDAIQQMADDGIQRAAVLTTSAYASYSGCRQYRENLADAVAAVEGAPVLDRLRHYFNHPGFVEAMVDSTLAALGELSDRTRESAHLVFVTHSIPETMNASSGPHGGSYVREHESVVEEIIERVRLETGHRYRHELTFCSRSGAPHIPWLEPDVNDHLTKLAEVAERLGQERPAVVVVPIGFVSDHMEVVWDLDTEAAATAEKLGLEFVRAATAGIDPRFVSMVRELVLERAAVERAAVDGGPEVERSAEGSLPACWDRCAPGCCPNPRGARPALGGAAQ